MKKIVIIVNLLLCSSWVSAQLNTDAQSVFKMLLFLDKENDHYRGIAKKISKNDSLYQEFSSVLSLKLDTLKIIKNNLIKESFSSHYDFYQLRIYDDVKRVYTDNVVYKRKLTINEGQIFGIPVGGCDSYVIAINRFTGVGYRLKGFNINDFLAFLSDIREKYNQQTGQEISAKNILNGFKVEGIDFQCLYEGLTASKIDRIKYPCLQRAADVVHVH